MRAPDGYLSGEYNACFSVVVSDQKRAVFIDPSGCAHSDAAASDYPHRPADSNAVRGISRDPLGLAANEIICKRAEISDQCGKPGNRLDAQQREQRTGDCVKQDHGKDRGELAGEMQLFRQKRC